MIEKFNNLSGGKKALIIIFIFLLFFGVIGSIAESPEDRERTEEAEDSSEEVQEAELPEYEVLDTIEYIETRGNPDEEAIMGHVLLTSDDAIEIPPAEMLNIAIEISEREDINYILSLYLTREAYEANIGTIVPDTNREGLDAMGGLDDNQRYASQEEIDRYLDEGFIGSFEDGEMSISSSRDYYGIHEEAFDEVEGINIR